MRRHAGHAHRRRACGLAAAEAGAEPFAAGVLRHRAWVGVQVHGVARPAGSRRYSPGAGERVESAPGGVTAMILAPSSRTRMATSTCPFSHSSNARFGHSISFTPGP